MDLQSPTLDVIFDCLGFPNDIDRKSTLDVHAFGSNTSSSGVTPQYHLLNMLRGFILTVIAWWAKSAGIVAQLAVLNEMNLKW